MPLLSYDPMEDGTTASANLWNSRISKLHDLVNGNLDAANLANGAVTTSKIADGAVTSAKLNVNMSIDGNGWNVNDYGSYKTYTKRFTGTPNVTLGQTELWNTGIYDLALPVGVNTISDVTVHSSLMTNDRCFVLGSWNDLTSTKLKYAISNWGNFRWPLNSYILDVMLVPLHG